MSDFQPYEDERAVSGEEFAPSPGSFLASSAMQSAGVNAADEMPAAEPDVQTEAQTDIQATEAAAKYAAPIFVSAPISSAESRLDALTRKIEQYPESPVNYVLRGEVYSSLGDQMLAAGDFRRAIQLGEQHDPALAWGYANAAYIDRAAAALRQMGLAD